jgi:hypothetical protein
VSDVDDLLKILLSQVGCLAELFLDSLLLGLNILLLSRLHVSLSLVNLLIVSVESALKVVKLHLSLLFDETVVPLDLNL